jgi:hypothetical protein
MLQILLSVAGLFVFPLDAMKGTKLRILWLLGLDSRQVQGVFAQPQHTAGILSYGCRGFSPLL